MTESDQRLLLLGEPGVGKATLAGMMMHKCGGIQLDTMQKLEVEGAKTYDEVTKTLLKLGLPLQFYIPPRQMAQFVYSPSALPDAVVLVVEPGNTLSDAWSDWNESIRMLFETKQVIVVVNKLDQYNWAEDIFQATTRKVSEELEKRGFVSKDLLFIPIAANLGDNLIESSGKLPWHKEAGARTVGEGRVVTLLDAIKQATKHK